MAVMKSARKPIDAQQVADELFRQAQPDRVPPSPRRVRAANWAWKPPAPTRRRGQRVAS